MVRTAPGPCQSPAPGLDGAGGEWFLAGDSRARTLGARDMTVRIVNVITRMIVGGPQQVSLLTARYYRGSPAVDYHLVFGRESGAEGDYHAEIAACGVPHHPQASLVRELAPARDLRALGGLVALLRRLRPHVVHARSAKARFLAPLAARLARVPVTVQTVHGWSFIPIASSTG